MSFRLGEAWESEDANGDCTKSPTFRDHDQDLGSEIQRRLDAASELLDELNDEREGLLVQREKVRLAGKNVHDLRIEAANAGVEFWNDLRQWFEEHQNAVPQALRLGYQRFQSTHDKLRTTEEDYIQTERNMVGLEWTWLDRTNDVYQIDLPNLFAGLINHRTAVPQMPYDSSAHSLHPTLQLVPSLPNTEDPEAEYHAQRAKLLGLWSEFDAIRRKEASRFETPDEIMTTFRPSEAFSASSDILEKMRYCEVSVQHSKEQVMQHTNTTMAMKRRNSDPLHYQKEPPLKMTTIERAQSESALATIMQSPKLGEKIGEWLLGNLENSYVARAIYRSFMVCFGAADSGNDFWLDHRPPYWIADDSEPRPELVGEEALSIQHGHRPAIDNDKRSNVDERGDVQSESKLMSVHRSPSSVEPRKAGSGKMLPQDTTPRPTSGGSRPPGAHHEQTWPPNDHLPTSASASRATSHAVYGLHDGDADGTQLQSVENVSTRDSNASKQSLSSPRNDSCFDLIALGTNEALKLPTHANIPEDIVSVPPEQLQIPFMITQRNLSHSKVISGQPGFQPYHPYAQELNTLGLNQVSPPEMPDAQATAEHERSRSPSRGCEHALVPLAESLMPLWPDHTD